MTTNDPQPVPHHLGYAPGGLRPLPEQANPTWLGHVAPEYYRQAPANTRGRVQPVLPPGLPPVRGGRRSASVVWLVLAGGFLAFISLFLVLPFLLGSTGISGFVIGFLASLIPLGTVLLTVRFIDRWEPEPSRCCCSPLSGEPWSRLR